jgi:hypothetical protein
VNVRALPAFLLLAHAVACGTPTPAAPTTDPATPVQTPAATTAVTPAPARDEVLLDLSGAGALPESRTFTTRGTSVNICWRLPGGAGPTPAELTVRVHDAMTREERAVAASAGTAAGCRALPIRAPGRPHYLSIAPPPVSPGTSWWSGNSERH